PIERLNSILVIAHSQNVLTEVHKWIEKLDSPSGGMNLQTFVYQVENSTAGNIADILSQLYSDGSGLPSGATAEAQAGQAQPRQQSIRPQESQGARRGFQSSLAPSLEGRPISQRAQAGAGSLLGGNVKIIVNEFNNSLIVQSTEADYQYIERTIKQLDVLPRQVLIEAKIYSVELRDELSFGIAAFLDARTQKLATTASVGSKTAGALNAATRFIIGSSREIEATLNALRTRTNVRILEAPRLLALDGQQAHINIGADVPVTTSSFGDPAISGNPAAFLNQIQFRPTGTTLLINPRISASGMVTMDLSIEVSSAVGSGLTPTINRNFVETSLVVRDGHSIAIGGIISDSDTLDRSRVPLLGDIPILGTLFGSTEKKHRRSELVILITPHVVGSVPQADSVSSDFQRALKRAYDFVREKEQVQQDRVEERTQKEIKEEQKRQEQLLKKKQK
ncbi:MAG TPA: secretin N-terminal domain-containing protein, partial [Acidobacteriota bacterium]|nr:secretin N-terminal domain-containing protein [Acidobacteriota bacterium]